MSQTSPRVLDETGPHLFRRIAFRSVTARNRIMLSPMCQYSAEDGLANDWHLVHLGARATGGAGIVCTEVVHVEPHGRISPRCLGLWNDAQRDALARIAAFVSDQGAVPAIQIGHAGRKGSTRPPHQGRGAAPPEEGGFPVAGPSPIPFAEGYPVPREMTRADIDAAIAAFAAATRRAREAGFRIAEIHGAHGYLIHQFRSAVSNRRGDAYGGDTKARERFLMEVIDAVRGEWPEDLPLFLRLSCTEWLDGTDGGIGLTIDDTAALARRIAGRGDVDLIDCSSGGGDPRQRLVPYPGYQIPFAERLRREAGIATGAVGLIHGPHMAEEVLANGRADLVILGRTLLADPVWPIRAAKALRAEIVPWPVQYLRGDVF